MPERARIVSILVLAIALALYVYAPLLPSGFFGTDFEVLSAVTQWDGTWVGLYQVPATDGRPLAAFSLVVSELLWARDGNGTVVLWSEFGATWLRLENIALLLITAWGVRGVVQSSLRPFLGAEQSRSAGVTAALFLFLHPLGVGTVAQVAERGELLAAACGALSMGLYLRARQKYAPRVMWLAIILAGFAAFAGRIAYLLPPLAALLEFLSARRHRPPMARLRTALVTGVLCSALVSVEWFLRMRYAPDTLGPPLGRWPELGGVAVALEKVGVLLLPVDTFGIGMVGYALAVIALLLALHPAFVAARSAPRLWGRLLLGWVLSLLLVEAYSLGHRVEPGSLNGSHVLFPAVFVMAIGCAISATAITGVRRTLVPAIVCLAFALLGRGHARPFEKLADRITDLRRELVQLAEARDWRGAYFLLDPPQLVAGVRVSGKPLAHLLDPIFLNEVGEIPSVSPWVAGGSEQAFAMYSRLPEFRRHALRGLSVLGAQNLIDGVPTEADSPVVRVSGFPAPTRPLVVEELAGAELEGFAALSYRHVSLELSSEVQAAAGGPPQLRWTGSAGLSSRQEVLGRWEPAGEGRVRAVFDLSRELSWLLGGTIQNLWLPGFVGQEQILVAKRYPTPMPPEVVPRRVGKDWEFDVTAVEWDQATEGVTWFLELLDTQRMEYLEYDLGPSIRGRVRATGLALWAEGILRDGRGPLIWSLEARSEGVPLARAQGRRELAH